MQWCVTYWLAIKKIKSLKKIVNLFIAFSFLFFSQWWLTSSSYYSYHVTSNSHSMMFCKSSSQGCHKIHRKKPVKESTAFNFAGRTPWQVFFHKFRKSFLDYRRKLFLQFARIICKETPVRVSSQQRCKLHKPAILSKETPAQPKSLIQQVCEFCKIYKGNLFHGIHPCTCFWEYRFHKITVNGCYCTTSMLTKTFHKLTDSWFSRLIR